MKEKDERKEWKERIGEKQEMETGWETEWE